MSSTADPPLGASAYSKQLALRRNVNIGSWLQGSGVSLDLNLPQICVLGSQSAGKSSLIESISTIALPRASGTCTRCPTECTMRYSAEAWRCDVYLRFKYDATGNSLSGGPKDIPFGSTIYEREEVKDRVARAQLAILNPNDDDANFPESFLTSAPPAKSVISFSRNVIVLKVSGPEVVDLSFVDLPGIVATSVRGGHPDDVRSVSELARAYVQNPNAIILLTVTCETDADNQGAYELVKEYDPSGTRTIGVTTKPDRIETGQENTWFKFLRNTVMPVANGWYCVKLPGPEQLRQKITWEEARQHEVGFFSQQPWANQVDLKTHYGVPSLTEKLSILLSDHIAKTLPGILREIELKITETQALFDALPKAPSDDPVQAVMQLVWEFERRVDREIAGTPDKGGLVQAINRHAYAFRQDMRRSAPVFVPFRPDNERSSDATVPTVTFLSDEERDLGTRGLHPVLYLSDIEARARESISRELPNNVPFAVKKEMIQNFIELWVPLFRQFLSESDKAVDQHFGAIAQQHFAQHHTLLRAVSITLRSRRGACDNAARERVVWLYNMEYQTTFTLSIQYLEDYRHKFAALFKAIRYLYKGRGTFVRRVSLTPPSPPAIPATWLDSDIDVDNAGATLAFSHSPSPEVAHIQSMYNDTPQTYYSPRPETNDERRERLSRSLINGDPTLASELLPLLPPDDGNLAIEIIADVRAYWQVAFKRFVDYVALAVDMEYVRGFGKDLGPALVQALGISGPQAKAVCARFLAEPREVAAERQSLSNKLERFREAQQAIENWQAGSDMDMDVDVV